MTYNHSPYIEEALKGIDIQETDFDFEVVVGDDFSIDDTLSIIKCFSFSNPKLNLKVLDRRKGDSYHQKRQKKGRLYNFVDTVIHCEGKYIALLDGDDYWTDPLKLQKQMDFLENNPDYNICFHRANMLKNGCQLELHPIPAISCNRDYLYKDLLEHYNFILTASVVFKKPENFIIPKWFTKLPFGDFGLYLLVSDNKKIKCLDDKMSVYRIHDRGVWSGLNQRAGKISYLQFYKNIYNALDSAEKKVVRRKAEKLTREIAKSEFNNSRLKQLGYYFYLKLKTINLWSLN